MKLSFDLHAKPLPIELTNSGRSYRATIGGKTAEVELLGSEPGKLELLIDGKQVTAYVSSENNKRWITVNGRTLMVTKTTSARQRGHGHQQAAGELNAPMPGQVRAVNVSAGETVTKGQTLLILEAMKMEIRVQAPRDGVVVSIDVKQGQTVEREQRLITME